IDNNSVGYGKIDLPEGVKVYPIPAKQVLNIEMPDPSTKWLDIRNVLGELVIQNTKNDHGGSQINVLNWPRGSYFVRVLTNQGLRVIPILIQ
ncbi:MAG: T9SS type A sorting domain-containing protein, partial [Saprospiraceae bacterium]|nr:T9SS type A sorting domain-containing protein [Saprospiraceae bacterium]